MQQLQRRALQPRHGAHIPVHSDMHRGLRVPAWLSVTDAMWTRLVQSRWRRSLSSMRCWLLRQRDDDDGVDVQRCVLAWTVFVGRIHEL